MCSFLNIHTYVLHKLLAGVISEMQLWKSGLLGQKYQDHKQPKMCTQALNYVRKDKGDNSVLYTKLCFVHHLLRLSINLAHSG